MKEGRSSDGWLIVGEVGFCGFSHVSMGCVTRISFDGGMGEQRDGNE